MADDKHFIERRRFPRRPVVGSATVLAADRFVGTFLLEDLSAGGALLVGDSGLAVGDHVRILLEIAGQPRFGAHAMVVRHGERGGQHLFGLSFQVSPSTREALQKLVLEAHSKASPLILVVHDHAGLRDGIAEELQRLGRSAVAVGTLLDMMTWLHSREVKIDTAAVGSSFAESEGLGVLEFLKEDHPAVRRVLVRELGGTNSASVHAAAHAVLETPWSREAFLEVFGELREA
jgi:hypothetical protein